MSGSSSSATPSDGKRELDDIADELYALRPDAFATARDEQVRQARAEGRQPLARELSRLRRPTQSAWLINLLWRDQREVMQQLFEVAEDLGRAHAMASGPDLQRLTGQRRELEAALIRRARALAKEAGVDVTASMEREAQETLSAAMALPDVADEVRAGRLVKPASYAGFGTLPSGVAPASAERQADKSREPAAASRPAAEVVDLQEAQRARERRQTEEAERARREEAERKRRQEAERRVQEARASLEAAAGALTNDARAAETAREHHQDLRRQIEQVQEQLRRLDHEVASAERAALAATRRRDQAQKTHAEALRTLERAEQELTS